MVTVASKSRKIAASVQHIFAMPFSRVYNDEDVLGVELGGSAKNVIAIATGMIDGLGLGFEASRSRQRGMCSLFRFNIRASLITRGLVEILRRRKKLGVEMPIFHEIYRILYENKSPRGALHRLMTRDFKDELDVDE